MADDPHADAPKWEQGPFETNDEYVRRIVADVQRDAYEVTSRMLIDGEVAAEVGQEFKILGNDAVITEIDGLNIKVTVRWPMPMERIELKIMKSALDDGRTVPDVLDWIEAKQRHPSSGVHVADGLGWHD